jgi:hypothetical protein
MRSHGLPELPKRRLFYSRRLFLIGIESWANPPLKSGKQVP